MLNQHLLKAPSIAVIDVRPLALPACGINSLPSLDNQNLISNKPYSTSTLDLIMRAMAKKKKTSPGSIAQNKKARHDYHIELSFEAGLVLTGWEVKSLREGKVQITESYVLFKDGEAWLFGAQITPLKTACTHVVADPTRSRKLLLHRRELAKLFTATQQEGKACVALALYWKGNRIKCEIAIATGKKQHDKRASEKERDWNREKQRVVRHNN